MSKNQYVWPLPPEISKEELIGRVLVHNPSKTRREVQGQIRHCQHNSSPKIRLPKDALFPRLLVRDWLLKYYPNMESLPGMSAADVMLESSYIVEIKIPGTKELPDAYRDLFLKYMKLESDYIECVTTRDQALKKLSRRGRPKNK